MKPKRFLSAILLMFIAISGCNKEDILPDSLLADQLGGLNDAKIMNVNLPRATGSVELIWKGADKGSDMGNRPDDLLVFFDMNAHQGDEVNNPKGELVYSVLKLDSSLHREIKADVFGVFIDTALNKGWIVATVVSDSKGCAGNGSGGHDDGCSSGSHDDGGCSHDDGGDDGTHDDGGCSHDTGTDGGTDDGTHDDGGCSHDTGTDGGTDDGSHDAGCSHDTGTDGGTDDGTHDDGGCSGGDSGSDDHGGCGGSGGMPGGDDKGNPMSGKNCRLGQIIAVKLHDGGTPGVNGDGITWKWFSPEGLFVPSMDNMAEWPHLCKKTIIGGNLVIHD